MSIRQWISLVCALALAWFETAATIDAQQPQAPRFRIVLEVKPVAFEKQRGGRVIARAEDENRKPVAGVTITLTLPSQGASGTFVSFDRTATLTTAADGRAEATFRFNDTPGTVKIEARAMMSGQSTFASIEANNPGPSIGGPSRTWLIMAAAAVGAAAIAGGVALSRPGAAPQPPPPTVITQGPGDIRIQ
jgi:hypothetical protein